MKILVVSDLHYSLQQFDWVIEAAPNYDLVVIAGDVLDLAGFLDLDAQIVVVTKYLQRLAAIRPIAVCSGNHDGDVKNEHDEFVAEWLEKLADENLYVDNCGFDFNGARFSVCPWWDGPHTQKEMAQFLATESKVRKPDWYWLHHAPPSESPTCYTGKKFIGDEHLRELIAIHNPTAVFSGHIHNAPFFDDGSWVDRVSDSWVFNPGHAMSPVPSYIEIDTESDHAEWNSYMGMKECALK